MFLCRYRAVQRYIELIQRYLEEQESWIMRSWHEAFGDKI